MAELDAMKLRPLIDNAIARFKRWHRLATEDCVEAFNRGRNERIQTVMTATLPMTCLSQAALGRRAPIEPGTRPGTLTIHFGSEFVVLDPLMPTPEFRKAYDRAGELLKSWKVAE